MLRDIYRGNAGCRRRPIKSSESHTQQHTLRVFRCFFSLARRINEETNAVDNQRVKQLPSRNERKKQNGNNNKTLFFFFFFFSVQTSQQHTQHTTHAPPRAAAGTVGNARPCSRSGALRLLRLLLFHLLLLPAKAESWQPALSNGKRKQSTLPSRAQATAAYTPPLRLLDRLAAPSLATRTSETSEIKGKLVPGEGNKKKTRI